MTADLPGEALELRSLVTSGGTLELSLHEVPVPAPGANQVLVRVEASPINPSDLGLLVAGADMTTATVAGTPERPIVTASLGQAAVGALSARLDQSLPVGNEGAGTVVAAGPSSAAQALIGKAVAIAGGAMYSQYRAVDASACLVLPKGATARDGASSFVNPMTALGMTETMRREGHSGLVHTAAASNLGQMLVKLCQQDGIPLVNIVRKPEQEELLRSLGATHVLNSTSPSFSTDLVEAIKATSATLAFDATGGGTLASQILDGMEKAANATAAEYSRYGSSVHKQVYIYGALDTSPTVLTRSYGMAWGIGGWLLTPFIQSAGAETFGRLRARVAAELTTTFASSYTREVSLAGVLKPDAFNEYVKRATGEKFLVTPHTLPSPPTQFTLSCAKGRGVAHIAGAIGRVCGVDHGSDV
jgi:NADPH:quinone reductase-like Zn-dependent oxidoreductase